MNDFMGCETLFIVTGFVGHQKNVPGGNGGDGASTGAPNTIFFLL